MFNDIKNNANLIGFLHINLRFFYNKTHKNTFFDG